jgi:hypothetical protein
VHRIFLKGDLTLSDYNIRPREVLYLNSEPENIFILYAQYEGTPKVFQVSTHRCDPVFYLKKNVEQEGFDFMWGWDYFTLIH